MMTSPVTNLTKVQTSTEQVLYIYIIQIPQTEEFYGFGLKEIIVEYRTIFGTVKYRNNFYV